MRTLGFILLAIGFLAASYFAVETKENVVPWGRFLPAAGLAAVGVVLAHLGAKRQKLAAVAGGGGLDDLRAAVDRIVEQARRLEAGKDDPDPYAFHGRIDAAFPVDLAIFVEHRKRIADLHGLQAYAEVMNDFAAGERYLNRVWSASVDGYIDEVREYVVRAREQFEHTQERVRRLGAS